MSTKIKHILKFNRGDSYNVDVFIKENDDMVFQNLITPKDAKPEVMEQFLYDAEIAALAWIFADSEDKRYAAY